MTDPQTTLAEIKQNIQAFRDVRGWVGEDPKDIALSLIIEAGELLELFQWKTGDEVQHEARLYGPICDELADVLWYIVVLAERLNIDIAKALEIKIAKNNEKYPAEVFGLDKNPEEKRRAYYRIKAKYRGYHPLAEED